MILVVDSTTERLRSVREEWRGALLLLSRCGLGVGLRPLLTYRAEDEKLAKKAMRKVPRHLVLSVVCGCAKGYGIGRVAAWCAGLGVECVTVFYRGASGIQSTTRERWDAILEGFPLAFSQLWPDAHAHFVRSWDGLRRNSRKGMADVTFFEFELGFGKHEIERSSSRRFTVRLLSEGMGREALVHATRRSAGKFVAMSTGAEKVKGSETGTLSLDFHSSGSEGVQEKMIRRTKPFSYIGEDGEPTEPELLLYFGESPGLSLGGYPPWELRFTEIARVGSSIEYAKYIKFLTLLERHSRSVQNFGR